MSTFAQLQTEVLNYGFDATAYTTRVQTWLNEAQRYVARTLDLPSKETDSTVTLVSGTNSYTLPATFQRIMFVVNDTDDQVLQEITNEEYESLDHTERGVPQYYFISNATNLIVYPAPDVAGATKTIRIHYVGLPTAMSISTDLSGMAADYDMVLKAYAISEAYAAEDDANMAQFWWGKFKERLMAMGEDLNYPDASGPNQVPGAWNF